MSLFWTGFSHSQERDPSTLEARPLVENKEVFQLPLLTNPISVDSLQKYIRDYGEKVKRAEDFAWVFPDVYLDSFSLVKESDGAVGSSADIPRILSSDHHADFVYAPHGYQSEEGAHQFEAALWTGKSYQTLTFENLPEGGIKMNVLTSEQFQNSCARCHGSSWGFKARGWGKRYPEWDAKMYGSRGDQVLGTEATELFRFKQKQARNSIYSPFLFGPIFRNQLRSLSTEYAVEENSPEGKGHVAASGVHRFSGRVIQLLQYPEKFLHSFDELRRNRDPSKSFNVFPYHGDSSERNVATLPNYRLSAALHWKNALAMAYWAKERHLHFEKMAALFVAEASGCVNRDEVLELVSRGAIPGFSVEELSKEERQNFSKKLLFYLESMGVNARELSIHSKPSKRSSFSHERAVEEVLQNKVGFLEGYEVIAGAFLKVLLEEWGEELDLASPIRTASGEFLKMQSDAYSGYERVSGNLAVPGFGHPELSPETNALTQYYHLSKKFSSSEGLELYYGVTSRAQDLYKRICQLLSSKISE